MININLIGFFLNKKMNNKKKTGNAKRVLSLLPLFSKDEISDVKKAIKEFNAVIKLEPGNEKAIFGLGFMYYHTGEKGLALRMIRNILKTNPEHIDANILLGV